MRNFRAVALILVLVIGWASNGFPTGMKIGLSYGEITSYLSNVITLQRSSNVDGQPRYMGLSADKLSMLEVIGDKSNVTQATLGVGLPNDSPSALTRNSAMMLRFVKNATPGWEGSTDWVVAALRKATATERPVEVTYRSRRITMTFYKSMGMVMVTVKHK